MKKQILFTLLMIIMINCVLAQNAKVINIAPFKKLSVKGNLNLLIVNGDANSVKFEGDSSSFKNVSVKNDNSTLVVNTTNHLFKKNVPVRIIITFKTLQAIKAYDGAQVECKEIIKADSLELIAGNASCIYLILNAYKLNAYIGEGSKITISGNCQSQHVQAYIGSMYNSFGLISSNTVVAANAGSTIQATAYEYLDAFVSTGGVICYKGNPEIKKEQIILGGLIEQITNGI